MRDSELCRYLVGIEPRWTVESVKFGLGESKGQIVAIGVTSTREAQSLRGCSALCEPSDIPMQHHLRIEK